MAGLFVTFEGVDRAGKTTQAGMLRDALGDLAVAVREPGGTPVAEAIRALVIDPEMEIGSRTEALLFAAARADLVEKVIRPALAAGRVVISDRFVDSSLAYQGGGRELGIDEVAAFNAFATHRLTPDITFLLEVDLDDAAGRRIDLRDDRIENEGRGLQERVLRAYEQLAAADPARWRRIDASRPTDEVHADVLAVVEQVLGRVGA
jgi:dTMP kinase